MIPNEPIAPLDIHLLWQMICMVLVLLMQAGFLCIEAGLTRGKNSIHVATTALMSLGVSALIYWIIGYGIIYNPSWQGVIGESPLGAAFHLDSAKLVSFALFQLVFCVTAPAILSGAIAERMRFSPFLIITAGIAGIIYPVFSHWVNNGVPFSTPGGWLAIRGFADFAGGSYVHSVGGWVSLAALIVIGPRKDRFGPSGEIRAITASNLPVAILGTILFFFGWMGFNGGSTYAFDTRVPGVLANTLLSGFSGLFMAAIITDLHRRRVDVIQAICGALAGLVSITACANVVSAKEALLIGAAGSLISYAIDQLLLKYRIDDAVSAFSVHVGGGTWGIIAVGLFGDLERIGTGLTRFEQIKIQLLGSIAAFIWAFGVGYLLCRLLNRITPLRVNDESEEIGLNISEHAAHTEWGDLLSGMRAQEKTANWKTQLKVEPFTDAGTVAAHYNRVLTAFENATQDAKKNARHAMLGTMAAGIAHEINNPLAVIQGRASQLRRLIGRPEFPIEMAKSICEDIETTSNRIVDIVTNLRAVARIGRRKSRERVAITTIIEEVRKNCLESLETKGTRLILPELKTPIELLCERTGILQILTNLVMNAQDAIQANSEKWVKIDFILSPDRKSAFFEVSDSGNGVPESIRDRIFEPFFSTKEEPHERDKPGLGLGLALAKAFAEDHGGSLSLLPEKKNTTFILSLPLEQV